MAMGRESEVQSDLLVTWAEMPRSPGHVFYDRLQKLKATISPLPASMPMCNLRQARRFVVPCFSNGFGANFRN